MEKMNENNRTKCIHLCLTQKEYVVIKDNFAKTTNIYLSEYIRKMLLSKPMIGTYRDQTMEDLMNVLVELKNELNSIGNNFHLTVNELPSLQHFTEYKA